MVIREVEPLARTLASESTVVAAYPYASREDPDALRFAQEDPRRLLAQHSDGALIDEAQNLPELFSFLQESSIVHWATGPFVLTGSQHFGLVQRIAQSLAGWVGFVNLLRFSAGKLLKSVDEAFLRGGYPPIFDMPAAPERW